IRPHTLRIEPTRGWVALRLGEVIAYRELLFFLVWRDLKVRYKQTILGVALAVLHPLLTMLVVALFFGRLARVPSDGVPYSTFDYTALVPLPVFADFFGRRARVASDGVPYSVFAYTALVPWTFFATGLTMASNSLVGSANLITKVYFPRLTIPLATVLAGLVDFALAFPVLFGLMWWYEVAPTAQVVWLPLFIALAFATALGVGLWLSALNVEFRDVRHVVPFLTQLWMFATPIAYPSSLLPERWRALYALNPMVGVAEGFRWALLGTATRPGPM